MDVHPPQNGATGYAPWPLEFQLRPDGCGVVCFQCFLVKKVSSNLGSPHVAMYFFQASDKQAGISGCLSPTYVHWASSWLTGGIQKRKLSLWCPSILCPPKIGTPLKRNHTYTYGYVLRRLLVVPFQGQSRRTKPAPSFRRSFGGAGPEDQPLYPKVDRRSAFFHDDGNALVNFRSLSSVSD